MKSISTCRTIRQQMREEVAVKSSAADDENLQKHLAACPQCQAEWQKLVKLQTDLAQFPQPDPGDLFWVNYLPRLRRRLDLPPARSGQREFAWIPAAAVALLTLFVLLLSPVNAPESAWTPEANSTNNYLSKQDYEKLAQIEVQESVLTKVLDESEADFIEELSQDLDQPLQDPMDKLAKMDDSTIDQIMAQLKSQPIIGSSANL